MQDKLIAEMAIEEEKRKISLHLLKHELNYVPPPSRTEKQLAIDALFEVPIK